jgi:hypothetical protein
VDPLPLVDASGIVEIRTPALPGTAPMISSIASAAAAVM